MANIEINKTNNNLDLDKIIDIWLRSNIETHSYIDEKYYIENKEFVREAFKTADIRYIKEDGEIKGFIGLNNSYIAGIFIDKLSRNKGYGKLLIDNIKKDYKEITLNVYCKNKKAIDFYKREGFVIVEESLDSENNEREYLMKYSRK